MKNHRIAGVLLAATLFCQAIPTTILPVLAEEAAGEEVQEPKTYTMEDVHVERGDGDHIVDLPTDQLPMAKEFDFKATVTLNDYEDGQQSAALICGNYGGKILANVHGKIDWNVPARCWGEHLYEELNCPGDAGQANTFFADNGIDLSQPFTMEVSVREKTDGSCCEFTYKINDVVVGTADLRDNYAGGAFGLMTFNSDATFSDIQVTSYDKDTGSVDVPLEGEGLVSDLGDYRVSDGAWTEEDYGLHSDAKGKGDCFLFSEVEGNDFIYSADIQFLEKGGAGALTFRSNNDLEHKQSYAVNVDGFSGNVKMWRWDNANDNQLMNEVHVQTPEDGVYNLKVVAVGDMISYYVNGVLVGNTSDYTMCRDDKGQDTVIRSGKFGLLNWNGDMIFQNIKIQHIDADTTPAVANIQVSSAQDPDMKQSQFFDNAAVLLQYVNNAATTAKISVDTVNPDAVVTITGPDETVYENNADVPLNVGSNLYTVTSTVGDATMTYRVNIWRYQPDEIYYNELYRNQFHYSIKEGWANDPNGMVYYNGKYHFFYQHYSGTQWGPMHWMHATTTDLIHWEEEGVAFAPDVNGAMFSGCAVADVNNESGLFDTDKGGLLAFITMDGNGQRIKIAKSEDEGKTWTKVNDIALDWDDDVLYNRDFRDPQVFKWEGKWFMVIAGGPLRIYSSDNLVDWSQEYANNGLHTECPAIWPAEIDGKVKWILDRGGRKYKVGDLKQGEDGKWGFFPDEAYADVDGIMNFGKDFYAAMAYYNGDFGTEANPTIPRIIEINWMNTWDNYCNQVADTLGQKFNGTFNLQLEVGLDKNVDGTYVLTQTPIKEYEDLRLEKVVDEKDVTVGGDNADPLADIASNTYEIVSNFKLEPGTTAVGFEVASNGSDEKTVIRYDVESDTISMDRSKSGILIPGTFKDVDSQKVSAVKQLDGSIDLHVYVDTASVELFANGNTVLGSQQIFPTPGSNQAAVIVEGTPCKADITVYELDSIWDKAEVTGPQQLICPMAGDQYMYVDDTMQLKASISPAAADQAVTWTLESGEGVVELSDTGLVKALAKGTAVIKVASAVKPELNATITVHVTSNNFDTNVDSFKPVGNWLIDDTKLINDNTSSNDFYMTEKVYEGNRKVETKVAYSRGLVNIFFASAGTDPFANDGAYSVQLTGEDKLRLFPFGKDDIATAPLDAPLNDGEEHTVIISIEGNTVTVNVDGKDVLTHEIENPKEHLVSGNAGLGLWDGRAEFTKFYVTTDKQDEPENPDTPDTPDNPDTPDTPDTPEDKPGNTGGSHTSGVIKPSNPGGSAPGGSAPVTPSDKGGLVTVGENTKFQNADGTYAKAAFKTVDDKTYYFDNDGNMVKDWKQIGSSWYYFGNNGDMSKAGLKKLNWGKSDNYYYFDNDGKMFKGWKNLEGPGGKGDYYFDNSGALKTNWLKHNGSWYYLGANGRKQSGWVTDKGKDYFLEADGKMATGWKKDNGGWIYLDHSGAKKTGWMQDTDGIWYFFGKDGKMAANTTVGIYRLDSAGKCLNPDD